jgi:hypothetical protein
LTSKSPEEATNSDVTEEGDPGPVEEEEETPRTKAEERGLAAPFESLADSLPKRRRASFIFSVYEKRFHMSTHMATIHAPFLSD